MLINGTELLKSPVMSLHTGGKIADLDIPLIDPENLKVEAYKVSGPLLGSKASYLRTAEIREIGPLGVIVDGADDIVELDDVIKIKQLVELDFQLLSLQAVDETGNKLGKVSSYSLDSDTFMIHKLSVKRGIFKAINDTGMLIDRSQIVEIDRNRIIVRSTAKKIENNQPNILPDLDYVNPFRKPSNVPQPEASNIN